MKRATQRELQSPSPPRKLVDKWFSSSVNNIDFQIGQNLPAWCWSLFFRELIFHFRCYAERPLSATWPSYHAPSSTYGGHSSSRPHTPSSIAQPVCGDRTSSPNTTSGNSLSTIETTTCTECRLNIVWVDSADFFASQLCVQTFVPRGLLRGIRFPVQYRLVPETC